MNNQHSFPGFFSGRKAVACTSTGSFTAIDADGKLQICLYSPETKRRDIVVFERIEMYCQLLNFLNVPLQYE
jgi:hypothetical protein